MELNEVHDNDFVELQEIAKSLCNHMRLRLLDHMLSLDTDLVFSEVQNMGGLAQPTISHHLSVLCRLKIIRRYNIENFSFYTFVSDEKRILTRQYIDTLKSLHDIL